MENCSRNIAKSQKKIDLDALTQIIKLSLFEMQPDEQSEPNTPSVQSKVDRLINILSESQQNAIFLKTRKTNIESELAEWNRKRKIIEMVEKEQQEINVNAQELFGDLKSYVNMKKEELWILEDNNQITKEKKD